MLLRKATMLILSVLSIFIFNLTTGIADAKTDSKIPWAIVKGFRSAKFGMDEKKVKRAITKDFKISKKKIKKATHPTARTVSFQITVPKLLAAGGTANIGYIFGQKSKNLIQVNVVWGAGVTDDVDAKSVVAAANLLRDHFVKKRYQEDGFALNSQLPGGTVIVFRGKDKKGSMILLVMNSPVAKKGESQEDANKRISLRLSYQLDPLTPDILTIKEGEF
jgi:hypothetical protein